jgi:hypothetical protein
MYGCGNMSEEISKEEYRKEKTKQEQLDDLKAEERARIDAQQQADAEEHTQKKHRKGKIFFYGNSSNEED